MRNKILLAVIVILAAAGLAFATGWQALAAFVWIDPAPVQPINFSHKLHAGDNDIACRFCHIYALKSRVSGVPPIKRCLGCHSSVRTDSPEIQKIHKYYLAKQPIPWVKVYNLPDYIYFPHKRHVKGGVKCEECHGDVKTMARVKRVPRLVMGWCLSCHRTRNGPADCWECHI